MDECNAISKTGYIGDWSWLNKYRITGPDVIKCMEQGTINGYKKFPVGKGRHIVSVLPNGKMMGDGAVVTPTEGTVYAPADGEVEFIFDTKHAIGFQTDSGIPMLLHMGIDTVKLEGKGFEILVTEGQKVKKGDPMMKLDLEFLTANAPSITSPILDTEPEDNQRIRLLANGEIKAGEPLFAVETLE